MSCELNHGRRAGLVFVAAAVVVACMAGCGAQGTPTAVSAATERQQAENTAEAKAAQTGSSLDRLLPGDIILEASSPDKSFANQRDLYGAAFAHAMIYVGVKDGRHMVVEALGPGYESVASAIEDKRFSSPKVVRVRDATDAQRSAAASLASTKYIGIPYAWDRQVAVPPSPSDLTMMHDGLKKNRTDRLYCSSLVWNAWQKAAGIDLDSDTVSTWGLPANALAMPKSYFVMPDDIAMSDRVDYVIRVDLPKAAPDPAPNAGASNGEALHTPKTGSPERKAILDALRVPVQKELEQPVIFKVDRIAVHSSFAFVDARALQPNGKPVDYSKVKKFAQEMEEYGFIGDDMVLALLQRRGDKWVVLEYGTNFTDYPCADWVREHGAPADVLP